MTLQEKNIRDHNLNWSPFPDHLNRILTIGGSGSGKPNALLDLIKIINPILV